MPRRKMPAETNWLGVIIFTIIAIVVGMWIIGTAGSGGGGGGPVHVRGYHRADGTYVAPHDRARPRH